MSGKDKALAAPSAKTVKSKRLNNCQPNSHSTTSTSSSVTSGPDFDDEYHQIAYEKFLRTMLEECFVDEKIKREETQMDIQMTLLADRFKLTIDQLDETNRRLKEISFIVEQNRLLDLKSNDYTQLHELSQKSDVQNMLNNLVATEQTLIDKLETKNVDFGYDKETGHKQLLDAVDEAITGLEKIKKHSSLDLNKLKEYEKSKGSISKLQKERLDLEGLRSDFATKFPSFSERLLKEASDKIAIMMNGNSEDESEKEDDR